MDIKSKYFEYFFYFPLLEENEEEIVFSCESGHVLTVGHCFVVLKSKKVLKEATKKTQISGRGLALGKIAFDCFDYCEDCNLMLLTELPKNVTPCSVDIEDFNDPDSHRFLPLMFGQPSDFYELLSLFNYDLDWFLKSTETCQNSKVFHTDVFNGRQRRFF